MMSADERCGYLMCTALFVFLRIVACIWWPVTFAMAALWLASLFVAELRGVEKNMFVSICAALCGVRARVVRVVRSVMKIIEKPKKKWGGDESECDVGGECVGSSGHGCKLVHQCIRRSFICDRHDVLNGRGGGERITHHAPSGIKSSRAEQAIIVETPTVFTLRAFTSDGRERGYRRRREQRSLPFPALLVLLCLHA